MRRTITPLTWQTGMKAQWGSGAGWRWGTAQGAVNAHGLRALQTPRVKGKTWGKGQAWLQGSKRSRGNSQSRVALWAKIMESSGVKRMNTERFKNTADPELIRFLYSVPHTHQASPQFKFPVYWIMYLIYIRGLGKKKNKRTSPFSVFQMVGSSP